MSDKTILEQWREIAYNQQADRNQLQRFWANYFNIEKGIYEQLLSNPDEVVSGTVKELAEKYGQDVLTMVGFLDGINDSLKIPNPIETMDENTKVTLAFDKELLYKNMVDAKADWLYQLPQWDEIFSEEKRKELSSRPCRPQLFRPVPISSCSFWAGYSSAGILPSAPAGPLSS